MLYTDEYLDDLIRAVGQTTGIEELNGRSVLITGATSGYGLETAKLFKENGVVDTTINAIVKEMDVAKGLFFFRTDSCQCKISCFIPCR